MSIAPKQKLATESTEDEASTAAEKSGPGKEVLTDTKAET